MDFNEVLQTLSEAIASGRIDQPRAIHCFWSTPIKSEADCDKHLANLLSMVESVWNSALREIRLSSQTTAQRMIQQSALVTYQHGQIALLTIAGCRPHNSAFELLVVGSSGCLRLEGGEFFVASSVIVDRRMLATIEAARDSVSR